MSKINGSQPLFGQMLFQSSEVTKVDNCVLGKEQGIPNQRSCRKPFSLDNYSGKNQPQIFGGTRRSNENTREVEV